MPRGIRYLKWIPQSSVGFVVEKLLQKLSLLVYNEFNNVISEKKKFNFEAVTVILVFKSYDLCHKLSSF